MQYNNKISDCKNTFGIFGVPVLALCVLFGTSDLSVTVACIALTVVYFLVICQAKQCTASSTYFAVTVEAVMIIVGVV